MGKSVRHLVGVLCVPAVAGDEKVIEQITKQITLYAQRSP
jgi:hypothetical protein